MIPKASPHLAIRLKLAWLPIDTPRPTVINEDITLENCLWLFENITKSQAIPMENNLQHLKRLVLDDSALGNWNHVVEHLEDPSIGNRHIYLEKLWLEIGYQDYATPFFLHQQCYLHLNYLTSLSLTFPGKMDTYQHLNAIFEISSVFSGHSLDITPLVKLQALHLSIGWEISRVPFELHVSDFYTLLPKPIQATMPLPNYPRSFFGLPHA
ncbi:hypothetical protein BJ165DRAFT_1397454 [Panaeolus papilionaceus]|nr:hypothetical protein BJ165DRAFT_1397454 [Panaeolus papilionaceus]